MFYNNDTKFMFTFHFRALFYFKAIGKRFYLNM